jgi:hypothetical protein
MNTMLGFAAITTATVLAVLAALALDWLLLRGVFLLMQPATADRRTVQPAIEHGTRLAAQAYAQRR